MIGVYRGLFTLLLMFLFIALTVATWSRRRKPEFDAMAALPLEDGTGAPAQDGRK
jgi:cbb3-type cytochrome oxidase subunit 3